MTKIDRELPDAIDQMQMWIDHLLEPVRTNHPYRKVLAAAKEYHRLREKPHTINPETLAPDVPWLLSVGFKARNYAGTNLVSPWARPAGGPVCHVEYDSLGGCDGWTIDDTLIPPMNTRAEVRALCAALKIPLNAAKE